MLSPKAPKPRSSPGFGPVQWKLWPTPEVILDRYIRTTLRQIAGFSGYVGKLDMERVEPEAVRDFLRSVQDALNEALRKDNVNASGGAEHPPLFEAIRKGSELGVR